MRLNNKLQQIHSEEDLHSEDELHTEIMMRRQIISNKRAAGIYVNYKIVSQRS